MKKKIKTNVVDIPEEVLGKHLLPKAVMKEEGKDVGKEESKRDKFVRLATFRVQKAIKAIYGVGKLSARAAYQYEDTDIVHITAALTEAVESTVLRFHGHKNLAEAFQISAEGGKI